MRYILASLFAIVIFAVPWFAVNYPLETRYVVSSLQSAGSELAAVFLSHKPKSVAEIKSNYNAAVFVTEPKKVRILLVPGHEPNFGGAEYGELKERDMAVEMASALQSFLGKNSRYEVFVTRDKKNFTPTFADYFKNDWDQITAWQKAHKVEINNLIGLGKFQPTRPSVLHQTVPNDVAMRIYGIDKWANDNDMDIVIHLHFNDYPGHGRVPGDYTGFTIYVPEKQYYNASSTEAVATNIFKRLEKYSAVSDLPGESGGIVEDQDLIAVGAFNSVDAASLLIEYGYIYEPQFTNPALHATAIRDLAFQTYLGLQDFFDDHSVTALNGNTDTLFLPHVWRQPISTTNAYAAPTDIFALQTALLRDGDYPPADKTKNDCPRSGTLGNCTKAALDLFQKKYNISGEKGVVGEQTLQKLNSLYSRL